jgi:signal transduction histidine kinase
METLLKRAAQESAAEAAASGRAQDRTEDSLGPSDIPDRPLPPPIFVFLLVMVLLAFIDRFLMLNTLLLESVHALVVTAILLSCLVFERRHPHIRRFGWQSIVLGIALLMLGTWIDILDDPPLTTGRHGGVVFPLGPSWERAFLKTTVGYSMGIGLFAYGFFQWIPWMIRTRLDMQKLNHRLSLTNRNLNRALMSLDEHIESERVAISRELHDDVAQQLTFINVQLQLCRKELDGTVAGPSGRDREGAGWDRDKRWQAGKVEEPAEITARWERARHKLDEVAGNVSEALRSVRQISGDLRPESLFSLGLVPALEQFIDKLDHQYPQTAVTLMFRPLVAGSTHTRLEKKATDAELLHLFRIIQEGTRNAIKHGEPTRIAILLEETPLPSGEDALTGAPLEERRPDPGEETAARLRIRIEDNGKGLPWKEIPPDDTLIREGHLGIVGLKERVRELGGTFLLSNRLVESGACLEIVVT